MKVLITGAAGFIGHALAHRLLANGHSVYGIDNLNAYYDVQLKQDRLKTLAEKENFTFQRIDIQEREMLFALFETERFDYVVHLAAQAGVRYSIENPFAYEDANLAGFLNILEPAGGLRPGIWCLHLRVQCMGRTARCRSLRRIRWIIRCRYMQRRKRRMS